MTPIGPPHQSVVDRLNHLLFTTFGQRVIVRVRGAVPARPRSEPQPDIAHTAECGGSVVCLAFPDLSLAVDDLLG